jgi:hypothetical protein
VRDFAARRAQMLTCEGLGAEAAGFLVGLSQERAVRVVEGVDINGTIAAGHRSLMSEGWANLDSDPRCGAANDATSPWDAHSVALES